ncbi:WG repeat-containing protein [Ferruginibacter sp. HRS2-29]
MIPCKYELIKDFKNDVAIVSLEGQLLFYRPKGKVLVF